MATFGWAYVDCADIGPDSEGPTGSVQFLTGANALSGSSSFMYHTAAVYGYAASTLVLTGTLVVSGTISASMYHIKDIAIIDMTGSTYFGDDQTDIHARTGSLELYSDTKKIFKVGSPTGFVSGSGLFHNQGAATFGATVATTGSISGSSTLHVVGAVTSTGNIATTGSLTANTLDIGGSDAVITADGNILTSGKISGSSTLQIVGAVTSIGNIATTGSVTANALDIGGSDLVVAANGNVSGSGTLQIVGAVTSIGNIATTGSLVGNVLDIGGSDFTVTPTGNVSGSGTLYAAGAATFSSTVASTGSISGSSTLQIVGAITSTGQIATTGSLVGNVLDIGGSDFTVTPTGNVSASGPVTITSLSASGESHFSGNLGIGTATPLYDLHVNGPGATVAAVDAGSGTDAYLRFLTNHVEKAYVKQGGGGNLLIVNQGTGGEIKFKCDNSVETLSMSDTDLSGSTTLHMVGATTLGATLATTGSITAGSHILPAADNTLNLGSGAKRWANLYTGDLHLKNERGDWTVVEEEDYLCVINNKTGKKFKMALIPIEEEE